MDTLIFITKKTRNMELHKEYYNLQQMYGTQWINQLLGNLTSYKYLRNKHTYDEINNAINDNNNN